jgi:hypothetical protein
MISLRKLFLSFRIKNIQVISKKESDVGNYLYLLSSEPSHKVGILVNREDFKTQMNYELQTGEPSLRVLDEGFFTISMSMMFTRNLPYTEAFMKRVNQMIDNDIIKHVFNEIIRTYTQEKKNEKIPPQVLTPPQLAIGFTIYLIACSLCILVFIIEYIFSFFTC